MLGEESWFHAVMNATNVQEERDAFISACVRGLPFSAYTGYFHNDFAAANLQCSFLGYPGKVPTLDSEGVADYYYPSYDSNLTSSFNESSEVQIAGDMSRMVAQWFSGFAVANGSTEDALEAGLYLASEALLTVTADASKVDSARPIYVSSGTSVVKPDMRNPAKAVVSFLVLAEIVGLLWLAWFSYRMPTFAARFDAFHVATIGAQLTTTRQAGARLLLLPPLGLRPRGRARLTYLKKLEDVDGLIGVQQQQQQQQQEEEDEGEIELMPLTRRSSAIALPLSPRTSSTLTPGPTSLHSHSHYYPPPTHASSPPPSPSVYDAQHQHQHHRSTPLSGGSHASLHMSFPPAALLPRPAPRVHSYASSSHTNDDIISALDAVSEVHADDPDGGGPPKYGDVVQADAERAAAAAAAAAATAVETAAAHVATATAQRSQLVVGGPGRITREMARTPPHRKARRTTTTTTYNTRGARTVLRPRGTGTTSTSASDSRSRSNRSSEVIGSQHIRSSRTM